MVGPFYQTAQPQLPSCNLNWAKGAVECCGFSKDFISFALTNRESKALPPDAIGNMDETPMWFDLPASKSYDFKGVKVVPAKTTGKEKLRYTVVLAAMANGAKLPPLIIFKGLKNVPKGSFPSDVRVEVSQKGTYPPT